MPPLLKCSFPRAESGITPLSPVSPRFRGTYMSDAFHRPVGSLIKHKVRWQYPSGLSIWRGEQQCCPFHFKDVILQLSHNHNPSQFPALANGLGVAKLINVPTVNSAFQIFYIFFSPQTLPSYHLLQLHCKKCEREGN